MKTMDKKHFEQLKKKADGILSQKLDGVSAREIMAQIYVDSLPDKSMEQGLMMADKALEAIVDFNKTYSDALDNKEGTVEKLMNQLLAEKDLVGRCNTLAALYAGISVADAKMFGEDIAECDEIIKDADEEKITVNEATQELESELKEKVAEALKNSAILSRGLVRQADYLDDMMEENGISQMVVRIGEDEVEYEGILTMVGYVESKTEEISEIPPDMTIEETAYIVAATMEEEQIIKRYSAGEIAMNVAVACLDVLGTVLLLKLALKIVLAGVLMATGICGVIMAIPAVLLLTIGIAGVVWEAVKVWDKGANTVINIVASTVKVSVRSTSLAMRKIGEFVTETVVPVAVSIVKRLKDYFNKITSKEERVIVNNTI